MAHPKRKRSKTRRDKRRTHDKIEVRPMIADRSEEHTSELQSH